VLGSFTPVLPSRSTRRFFPIVHPFRVPLANLFLVWSFRRPCSTDGPSWLHPLHRATFAQWVILTPVAVNSFCRPHFYRVQIFLMMIFFRHATFALRDTFLQATADFLLGPLFSWVLSFPILSGSAPRTHSGPCAASSVPWGSPDAPLWTASFLDWVQSLSLPGRQSSLFSHPGPSAMHQVWISSLLDQI
jgi:hypothetical protein